MENYFSKVKVNHKFFGDHPIRWQVWSPDVVYFKSNQMLKKLLPDENLLSYKSKGHRDNLISEMSGGTPHSNGNHTWYSRTSSKAVHVHLKNVTSEFATANVDFVDYTDRRDVNGNQRCNLDILSYVSSRHCPWDWVCCPQTGSYNRVPRKISCDLEDGYEVCFGGQGESNSMSMDEWDEWLDIMKGIRQFLFEVVVPYKRGDFNLELVA